MRALGIALASSTALKQLNMDAAAIDAGGDALATEFATACYASRNLKLLSLLGAGVSAPARAKMKKLAGHVQIKFHAV